MKEPRLGQPQLGPFVSKAPMPRALKGAAGHSVHASKLKQKGGCLAVQMPVPTNSAPVQKTAAKCKNNSCQRPYRAGWNQSVLHEGVAIHEE